jgi:NAD(P)-dependent dehydrogenase (short-subunit alcohol dehydrogenase family)
MAARRAGRIINISSHAALHGQIGQAAYAAAKGGVNAFTKVLARELASSGVTVNAVCPGATETPPLREFCRTEEGRNFTSQLVADVPLGRLAQPEEIAATVGFLASKGAGYITGELILIAGGVGM